MWGTWWVWDARLTSVLVLFFLWVGHAALTRAFEDDERGARPGPSWPSWGVVNLPIVKFSWIGGTRCTSRLRHASGRARGCTWTWYPAAACDALGFSLLSAHDRAGAHARRGDGAAHPLARTRAGAGRGPRARRNATASRGDDGMIAH
jgi:hypothetical protein